jgi:hypothetical protein
MIVDVLKHLDTVVWVQLVPIGAVSYDLHPMLVRPLGYEVILQHEALCGIVFHDPVGDGKAECDATFLPVINDAYIFARCS